MIILDTNVISELACPQPSQSVLAWADSVHGPAAATTATTAAELLYGVARLADGHRKSRLAEVIQQLITVDLGGRVHPFDLAAARHYAEIVAKRTAQGHPIAVGDAQIAAICLANDAVLATGNTKDFANTGVKLINPWEMS
jgi:predicted nucleic acid-binding protein